MRDHCYVIRPNGTDEMLRRVGPYGDLHLLIFIQNVGWEAAIQNPGEDGGCCSSRSSFLSPGHFTSVSHTCIAPDLKLGSGEPKGES